MRGLEIESEDAAARHRAPRRAMRLLAVLLMAAALAPGLWVRTPQSRRPPDENPPRLVLQAIPFGTPAEWPPELKVSGAWHLTSGSRLFGGYSALLANPDGTLTAYSDDSTVLQFPPPDSPANSPLVMRSMFGEGRWKSDRDLESATEVTRTGQRWFGFEWNNRIARYDPAGSHARQVFPKAMADWPANGGAEAMARLSDGRFIVLREDPDWLSSGARPGLLFPSDPVDGAQPIRFTFRPPISYDPSDMATLPDGRVVILVRALNLPLWPFFRNKLLIADPRQIVAGKPWPWRELATFYGPVPRDNYEGLTIVPDPTGVTMWLISDDNKASYQRTLLLKLHWGAGSPSASRPRN